uniref:Sacsin n=1 Tax=Homo sapiens TaxID=9606 RepID=UPI000B34A806|nr:Chain A, Sacsin [Homo sapiens]5VSX_B Chain B, Sacsin [Homo sapiens]
GPLGSETKENRWVPVTVLPGCVGCRTVAALASWTVRDVKERIFAETGFPVSEQRLWRGGRELSDWIKIGDLTSKNCHLFVNLQSKGLKG